MYNENKTRVKLFDTSLSTQVIPLPEGALSLLCAAFHGRAGQLGLTQAGDARDSGTVN